VSGYNLLGTITKSGNIALSFTVLAESEGVLGFHVALWTAFSFHIIDAGTYDFPDFSICHIRFLHSLYLYEKLYLHCTVCQLSFSPLRIDVVNKAI
jgi:hypothetical protein